jgi:hypothetical protein
MKGQGMKRDTMKGHEMNVDERELLGPLGDVTPLSEETFEQARALLQVAIAAEVEHQIVAFARRPTQRRHVIRVRTGIAAGVAAAVAFAFVGLSLDSTSKVPTASKGHLTPLVLLADNVNASPAPVGNAELVARTTSGGGTSVTVYDLYADNGEYFFSQTESGLAGQVSANNNLAGGLFTREIAAAKLAAGGNVQTAAQDMADAPDPSNVISPSQAVNSASAAAKQAATGQPQEGNLYDNWVWENSQDAIIASAGQPQVRAGVLLILATLPGVTVTSGTAGGQSTLVLTAGTPEMGYGLFEQLTINATTGVPVSFASGTPGQAPSGTISYQVSRVTTGNIAAGKF